MAGGAGTAVGRPKTTTARTARMMMPAPMATGTQRRPSGSTFGVEKTEPICDWTPRHNIQSQRVSPHSGLSDGAASNWASLYFGDCGCVAVGAVLPFDDGCTVAPFTLGETPFAVAASPVPVTVATVSAGISWFHSAGTLSNTTRTGR